MKIQFFFHLQRFIVNTHKDINRVAFKSNVVQSTGIYVYVCTSVIYKTNCYGCLIFLILTV